MAYEIIERFLIINPDRNRTYIDIGTGDGKNVALLAKYFKKIFAHDPDENSCYACKNLENVTVRNYAVYNTVCLGELYKGTDSKSTTNGRYFKESTSGDLNTLVLDMENWTDLDFLKVDTFGNEIMVLKGCEQTLLRCKPLVQVELTDYTWTVDKQLTFEYLSSLGYQYFNKLGNSIFMWIPEVVKNIENNTIFCFWTGTNPMSENRLGCINNLRTQTDANLVLVTVNNLQNYILDSDPLHEAYNYLSETHKCDYLRIYFMHHYGGGYTDIKSPRYSWAEAFQDMRNDPAKIINGYKEKGAHCIAYAPVAHKWDMLCGNGGYILRPRTALTHVWYRAMLDKMDEKLEELRARPAHDVADAKEWGTGYPLEWNEMLGRIFHRVLAEFEGFILYSVPKPYGGWYR